MPTARFEMGGKKYRVEVSDTFKDLSKKEQDRILLQALSQDIPQDFTQSYKDEGWWDQTKDTGKEVGGFMLKALHQLGRPQSAIAGGLFNIQEEVMGKGGDEDRSWWEKYVNETLEGMKEGFTYEDEKRIQDLMAQANPQWVKEHPILSTVLGFAGDVLSDPLNLLGVGLIRQAIAAPVKGLSAAIGKTPTGAALAQAADNPVLRAFNVYTGDKKKARALYIDMLDKIKGSQAQLGRQTKIDTRHLKSVAKELGIPVDDLQRQIAREVEGAANIRADLPADLTGAASAVAKAEAESLSSTFGRQIAEETADVPIPGRMPEGMVGPAPAMGAVKGPDVGIIGDAGGEIGAKRAQDLGVKGYLPHLLKETGRRGRAAAQSMRDLFRRNPSAARREHGDTLEGINVSHRGRTDNPLDEDFFITDIPVIEATRTARSAHTIAGKDFLRDVAATLGRRADEAPDNWKSINHIEGVRFDPEVAPFIEKMYKTVHDPKELGKALKFIDGSTRWWKMWSLGLRPAYHARNVVGNLWNAYNIGGMSNPIRAKQAMDIQRMSTLAPDTKVGRLAEKAVGAGKFHGKQKVGKFGQHSNEDLWRMANEDGVLNHGQYSFADLGTRDVERFVVNQSPKTTRERLGAWVTPSTKNRVLRGGFAAGRALENNTRLALYLDTLAKTGSRQAAKNNVKKSLFDYGDLSSFEQNVMKRFVPFYTWSRKNIPAQVEALIKNPQRGVKVDHLIDNIQYGIDTPSPDEINEWMASRDPVFMDKFFKGGDEDVHKVVTLMNYLPLVDPERLVEFGPVREGGWSVPTLLAEMTTPFLKAPIEALANYDLYRGRDIREYPDQTVDFLGVKMPVHLAKLAQNLVMLSEWDRLNPGGMFGEATRDPETGRVDRTESIFGAERESRIDAPMSHRLLQYIVGIKPYEVTADQKIRNTLKVKKDYDRLKRLLRSALASGKTQKAEEIQRAMVKMMRTMGE